jgi:hypothetical protein
MSNSRTRRRTKGAFGNNKPRSIEREFTSRPQLPATDGAPAAPNVADKLANYAQPILEQSGSNRTAAQGAMNVAILIWNASIEGDAKITEAKAKLNGLPGSSPEQVEELVSTMLTRKKDLYPDENLLITNFILKFNHRTGTTFRVSGVNMKPEGLTKSAAQDIIKAGL